MNPEVYLVNQYCGIRLWIPGEDQSCGIVEESWPPEGPLTIPRLADFISDCLPVVRNGAGPGKDR